LLNNYIFLGIPVAERFCFCLNTALSDIAYFCPEYSLKIIDEQITLIEKVAKDIIQHSSKLDIDLNESSTYFQLFFYSHHFILSFFCLVLLCQQLIPIFLGLCRSVGRCSTRNELKDSLFLKLFPLKNSPPKCDLSQEQPNEYDSYFLSVMNCRKSISKSSSTNSSELKNSIRKENLFYDLNGIYAIHVCSSNILSNLVFAENNLWNDIDFSYYFFYKYGSSFDLFIHNFPQHFQLSTNFKKKFDTKHLRRLFSVFKLLLKRDIIKNLDDIASKVYNVCFTLFFSLIY